MDLKAGRLGFQRVLAAGIRREGNRRRFNARGTERLHQRVAVFLGHADVGDEHVRGIGEDLAASARGTRDAFHHRPRAFEHRSQQFARVIVVFDDQNPNVLEPLPGHNDRRVAFWLGLLPEY